MSDDQLPAHIQAPILAGIRRRKRDWLKGALGMFALAIIVFPAVYFSTNQANPLMASLIGSAIVAAVGIPLLIPAFGDPTKDKALGLLRERPASSIVWLFRFTTARRGAGVSINVGFDDGTLTSVTVPPQNADEVFAALVAHAPHATREFSEELAQSFRSSPGALRTAPG